MKNIGFFVLGLVAWVTLVSQAADQGPPAQSQPAKNQIRLKDLVHLEGLRENQLVGLGLVTGLSGQGDSSTNPMLQKALSSLVSHLGFNLSSDQVKSKNTAVVSVTCSLPWFVAEGEKLDITVTSIGDAKSLEGGYLLQTPLLASNGKTYAVAQGRLFSNSGKSSNKTAFFLSKAALAEKSVTSDLLKNKALTFLLNNPDFTTAQNIGQALLQAFPQYTITVIDASRIMLSSGKEEIKNPVEIISKAEALKVLPDFGSKVVINRTSGIVIAGRGVQVAEVAVSVRGAKITIGKNPSQTFSSIDSRQTSEQFVMPASTTVEDLVTVLQQIGLGTDVLIDVFRAIDQAGALYGALEIVQ